MANLLKSIDNKVGAAGRRGEMNDLPDRMTMGSAERRVPDPMDVLRGLLARQARAMVRAWSRAC